LSSSRHSFASRLALLARLARIRTSLTPASIQAVLPKASA
jgi:hypothetical protein